MGKHSILGVQMHQFSSSFFLIGLKLERPIIKSKGRTGHATACCTVCMNTGRVIGDSRPKKTRNNPILNRK